MKVFKSILKIALCLSIAVVLVIAVRTMKNRRCESIEVTFAQKNDTLILHKLDVQQLLTKNGMIFIGKKIKEISLDSVSTLLDTHPYVEKVRGVYFSGSILHIDLQLRQPILHVYTLSGAQYGIDRQGVLCPWLPSMQQRTLLANGLIRAEYQKNGKSESDTTLHQLYLIASAIYDNPFFKALISQLYVKQADCIEMLPVIGNQTIVLGNAFNIENKLNILQTVYKKGLIYSNIDKYSQLDLRYKNRVIAKRK